jgi:L-asparaginase
VAICTATLGDDAGTLDELARLVDGLVVAGFGVGHVPESWPPVLEGIAGRVPVVLASRVGAGYVATSTYGFAGAESDLIRRGAIPAGALDPYKARLLLQLALMQRVSQETIAAAFRAAGGLGDPGGWPWG